MYSANLIAKYIIKQCSECKKPISNLKLQKILYFVQAEFLVTTHKPCFEEKIEAWDFGPVVPLVYNKYKIFGGAIIPYIKTTSIFPFSKKEKELIDGIIEQCIKYSASELTILSLQKPWEEASKQSIKTISTASIMDYYTKL